MSSTMTGLKLLFILFVLMSVEVCGRISKARRDTRASGAELERIPNMHRKMLGLPGLVVNEDGIVEIHRDASEKPENISDNLMGLLAFLGLAAFVTNQVLKEINARKLQDTYIDPQRAFHEAEAKGTGMDASCKVTLRDIHNLKEFVASSAPKAVVRARNNRLMQNYVPHTQRDFTCGQTTA